MKLKLTTAAVIAAILAAGCSKTTDTVAPEPTDLTGSLEKIVTSYYEGCNKYEGDDPSYDKEAEERRSRLLTEAQKEQIRKYLEEHPISPGRPDNISHGSAANGRVMGWDVVSVIKSNSCGTQDELEIFMDNEDRRNTNGRGGWFPTDWVMDGNLRMRFCAVPVYGFYWSNLPNDHYGVLLTSDISDWNSVFTGDTYLATRYYDTEDNNNISSVTAYRPGQAPWSPTTSELGGTGMNSLKDIILRVLVFSKRTNRPYPTPPVNALPSLAGYGINSYGVFGSVSFATEQGYVHTDDEDRNNINKMEWIWPHVSDNPFTHGGLGTIFTEVGENTTFTVSKLGN